MKNTLTTYAIFTILLFVNLAPACAQKQKIEKATADYDQLNYVNAQKIYLAVAEKGFESEELYTKLANSYYFNAQYDQAVKWYDKLFRLNPEPENPLVFLRYSQALKSVGEQERAGKLYDLFLAKNNFSLPVKSALDYKKLIAENSGRYEILPLEKIYNKDKISFGHVKVGDTLYYASTDNTKSFINTRSGWDGLSFLSLYRLPVDSLNQATGSPKLLGGKLNSKFHESSPVFSADGTTMYFTRSNMTSQKKKDDQKLKIYRSIKVDKKWQKAEELSINSDFFSSAHPALSPDGTKLYFASDRPGGYGESDLYVSKIDENGNIGEPVNLGPEINTSGKETFPFVTADHGLYFSSDGHFGMGGLDVFYVKIQKDGIGNLLNIGAPINSYADDFAFGINPNTGRGFISSNRSDVEGGFILDNIYTFLETAPLVDVYLGEIKGTVTDKQNELPIAKANIILSDGFGKEYKSTLTDSLGQFSVEINKFDTYYVKASHAKFDTEESLSKPDLNSQIIDFQLQPNEIALSPGVDLAKVLNIPIIYFDFDKSNIRRDAQVELEKVLATLNEYPNVKIEIRSHSDSRGNDAYNLALSQRRATATLNYLVEKDIDANRLTAKGMGETNPVNGCSNGVKCSETEHQKNRRSEFLIMD